MENPQESDQSFKKLETTKTKKCYDYIYNEDELRELQDFTHEPDCYLTIRYILLTCLCLPFVTSYLYWDWHYFLVPFTNWTLIITFISIAHSVCGYNNRGN